MLMQLFLSFLKIGAFTIGGAYAMIPLIRKEVCDHHKWISEEEFMDGLAAAQSCPGPIAVNISIYVGYHIAKGKGMAVAVLGTIIPSTICILLIAMLFNSYADATLVQKAFHALRPAVVALIAVPLVEMARKAGVNYRNMWYPLGAALLAGIVLVSPMYLILATIVYSLWQSLRDKRV